MFSVRGSDLRANEQLKQRSAGLCVRACPSVDHPERYQSLLAYTKPNIHAEQVSFWQKWCAGEDRRRVAIRLHTENALLMLLKLISHASTYSRSNLNSCMPSILSWPTCPSMSRSIWMEYAPASEEQFMQGKASPMARHRFMSRSVPMH